MHQCFQQTKTGTPIPQEDMWSLCARTQPGSYYAVGRQFYLPIVETELVDFLKATLLDRYVWRKAAAPGSQPGTIEVVCCTFSFLLAALVEQERLRQGLPYPLAFSRVEVQTGRGGHSLNGFYNPSREWRFVEPQNDTIFDPTQAKEHYPGIQIQNFMFV